MGTLVVVEGSVRWFKLRDGQENKFGKLTVDFFPTPASRKIIGSLRIKNQLRETEEGEFFYKFNVDPTKGNYKPVRVIDVAGKPTDALLGNGTKVKLQLDHYEWATPEGTSHGVRPVAVKVTELVVYKKPEPVAQAADASGVEDDFDKPEVVEKPPIKKTTTRIKPKAVTADLPDDAIPF